jgi:arylsulfatase A-like enzyme
MACILDAIQDMGELDDTLVIYIQGDNRASAEGAEQGLFNEMGTPSRISCASPASPGPRKELCKLRARAFQRSLRGPVRGYEEDCPARVTGWLLAAEFGPEGACPEWAAEGEI